MVKNASDRWAVLIGINGYHESLGPLNFCANDAMLMHETLASESCAFPADNIVLLTDDQPKDRQPTFGNIHSWLGTWLSRPGPDDLVLVYFAGHGREIKGQALLAPLDATLDSLPVTGIPIQYLRDMLDRCRAAQKVLILDACHSGGGRDVATMSTGFREALDAGKGLYTIASCDADQISYEWPEKKQGVFTHFLVEAIGLASPDDNGCITVDAAYEWTHRKVMEWSGSRRMQQEPIRLCRGAGRIPIASRIADRDAVQLPPDIAADLAKANMLLAAGKLKDAEAVVREGLRKEPLSYELNKMMRDLKETLRQREEAERQKQLQKVQEHVEGLLRDSEQYETDGNLESAIACLESASAYQPHRVVPLLARLRERADTLDLSVPQKLERLFSKAEELEQAAPESAVEIYREALEFYPGNARATNGIGKCLTRIKLRTISESVRVALATARERMQGLTGACDAISQELAHYRNLAMEREAELAARELASSQGALIVSRNECNFLERGLTVAAAANDVAGLCDAVSGDADMREVAKATFTQEGGIDRDVISIFFPQIGRAVQELEAWRRSSLAALRDWESKKAEAMAASDRAVAAEIELARRANEDRQAAYQKAIKAEDQRIQAERERANSEYARQPFYKRPFTAPQQVERRKIPEPKLATPIVVARPHVPRLRLPGFPAICIEELGEHCLAAIPDEIKPFINETVLREWCQQATLPVLHPIASGDGSVPAIDPPTLAPLDSQSQDFLGLCRSTGNRLLGWFKGQS